MDQHNLKAVTVSLPIPTSIYFFVYVKGIGLASYTNLSQGLKTWLLNMVPNFRNNLVLSGFTYRYYLILTDMRVKIEFEKQLV